MTAKPKAATRPAVDPERSRREGVESIVVAVVLAFLFRAFEAEAFVIPTGSMAPTLQGQHKDLECPQCGFQYRTGATADFDGGPDNVEAVMCPMCFFTAEIDLPDRSDHRSFSGDRILVNKFAYEPPFGEPKRWDVIVFKYPGNAKQNYIKRLIGLPEETVRIHHGDIFIQSNAPNATDDQFHIARKPADKIQYLLQDVHDTHFIADDLRKIDWPLNWQSFGPQSSWKTNDEGATYECSTSNETSWLHFRQHYLDFDTWSAVEQMASNGEKLRPQEAVEIPVTDFYAYNAHSDRLLGHADASGGDRQKQYYSHPRPMYYHWVGDLAIDAEFELQQASGQVVFDLIEAGRHHQCVLDAATGQLTLQINDGKVPFDGDANATRATASTSMKGPGTYHLRFANLDDELHVWVDGEHLTFDHGTTYGPTTDDRPTWSADEPGDLHPVRIGARQTQVRLTRLKVLRDVYYIATDSETAAPIDYPMNRFSEQMIVNHLTHPELWQANDLFDARHTVHFKLAADQFFPLGDNSPFSKDGRMWGREYYIERDLLIGKAVMVYWPHGWPISIPFVGSSPSVWPNFRRMGLIH